MRRAYDHVGIVLGLWVVVGGMPAMAQTPGAIEVVEYTPAPGQWVNDALLNDPGRALGWPAGGGAHDPQNQSLVSLGGFGGSITLGFDHTVLDEAANPFGIDATVFGNAFFVSGNPNRRWAECGFIEISRDENENGVADDAWYVIPGSHIVDLAGQWEVQGWDDQIADATFPPADETWIPSGNNGYWETAGYRLPGDIFEQMIVVNPLGVDAGEEGIFGYADFTPTLKLGDVDGDNAVDDPDMLAEDFYTRPDHPFVVGTTPGCGGGDGIDIAWAVDAATGMPAELDGFDFIRITTAVNAVITYPPPPLGELSVEIDAVVDVLAGQLGDSENDGDVDLDDWRLSLGCLHGPEQPIATCPCRVMDFGQDGDFDLADVAALQNAFTGASR